MQINDKLTEAARAGARGESVQRVTFNQLPREKQDALRTFVDDNVTQEDLINAFLQSRNDDTLWLEDSLNAMGLSISDEDRERQLHAGTVKRSG